MHDHGQLSSGLIFNTNKRDGMTKSLQELPGVFFDPFFSDLQIRKTLWCIKKKFEVKNLEAWRYSDGIAANTNSQNIVVYQNQNSK